MKKLALNPLFWTELSELNSIRRLCPTDVIIGGIREPQKTPCFLKSLSPNLLLMSTLSYSQSCYRFNGFKLKRKNVSTLTLLPSKSKWVKLRVILKLWGAIISQMQFLLGGYKSGNEGLIIVPFVTSMTPPQASSHFLPSECNSYPIRHSHRYPPKVLTQWCSHPWSESEHSSNSLMKLAEKPAFWTELSDMNLTNSLLELDRTDSGTL